MSSRLIAVSGWLVGFAMAGPIIAAEPQIHKGTVISASAGKLVLKDMAGREQAFSVDAMTKITVHGKPGKLEDLQETMPVQVTTEAPGKVLAVSTIDMEKSRASRPRFTAARVDREFKPEAEINW